MTRKKEGNAEAEPRPRVKGGGKLNRSETVTARLDPRLNYLAELASRAQRRTKSSFLEWAIEHVLKDVKVPGTSPWGSEDISIEKLATSVWDVDEVDRLAALAFNAPILLTHEEQVIWKVITNHGGFWKGNWQADGDDEVWTWAPGRDSSLLIAKVRDHFDTVKAVADGTASAEELPAYTKRRPKEGSYSWDDLDDEIPF